MSAITVKNAADTWVNQNRTTTNYNQKPRLHLRTSAGANKYAFIYFNKPWPPGATIISAKLRLFSQDAWTGATTITVERPSAKWGLNRITYTNAPGTTGASAAFTTAGSTAADTMIDVDVTSLAQSVSNGSPWYGFRIRTSQAVDTAIHSAQAGTGGYRPALIVSWTETPDQPTLLKPSGGRSVSPGKQFLTWDFSDVSGDQNINAVQVQFGSTEANTNGGVTTFDSGTVASSEPQLDLNTTAFTATTNGASSWWRARNQDASLVWSPWSAAVNYLSTTKGTLTITLPVTAIYDGSPTVTWTFTGQTQRAYQVIIVKSTDPNNWLWDSGKITGAATSVGIPFGIIDDATSTTTYVITVRVWDTISREAIPNDHVYVQASTASLAIGYDATVAAATSLAFLADTILPIAHLTWVSAVAPDAFQIQRSDDGGTTWYFYDEKNPFEITAGGTNYAWDDMGNKRYVTHSYKIIRVVGGKMSASSPTTSGSISRIAPILMRPNGTDLCMFLNPERDRQRYGVQAVFQRMVGPPVLVTQRVGGQGGNVTGIFVDGTPTGYTAKQMKKSFLSMEADSGKKMILAIADETLNVVAYNFNLDVRTDTSGVTYLASFSWIDQAGS